MGWIGELRLGVFLVARSEYLSDPSGFCSKRRRLCPGCGGPAGVCSGFPLPAGIVYEKAVECERGGVGVQIKMLCTYCR